MARIRLRAPLVLVALLLQAQEYGDPPQGMLTVSMCAAIILAFSVIAFAILRRRAGAAHALLTRVPTPLRFFLIIAVFITGLYGAYLLHLVYDVVRVVPLLPDAVDDW